MIYLHNKLITSKIILTGLFRLKRLLLFLFVLGGFCNCIFGQETAKGWKGVPEEIKVFIDLDGKKIESTVKMHYYLEWDNKKYYRQKKNSTREFGIHPKIDETAIFKVRIEFVPKKNVLGKYKTNEKLRLKIAGASWIKGENCFKANTKTPIIIHHKGGSTIDFKLKPDCKGNSTIKIDFKFFKQLESGTMDLNFDQGDRKNKSKQTTTIKIPIKIGVSKTLEEQRRKAEDRKTTDLRREEQRSDSIRSAEKAIADKKQEDKIAKERNDAIWFSNHLNKVSKMQLVPKIRYFENVYDKIREESPNPRRENMAKQKIIETVELMFNRDVLPSLACSDNVQGFSFNNYLSNTNKKKYKELKEKCEKEPQPPTPKEDVAWAEAKSKNTIVAYEKYIDIGKNEKNKEEAKKIIKKLKDKDERFWKKTNDEIKKTNNPCKKVEIYGKYIDYKNKPIHEKEAKEARKKASELCNTFRLESEFKEVNKGFYTFKIKKGEPPFTTSFRHEHAKISIDSNKNELILKVLEGGQYTINLMDKTNQSCKITFWAENPNFMVYKEEGMIVVQGGESPFDFVSANSKQTSFKERIIKENHLVQELGLKETSGITIYDKNGLMAQNIKSSPPGKGGDGSFPKWLLIIPATLLAGAYLLRKKIPILAKVFNRKPSKEKLWQKAESIKTTEAYNNFLRVYTQGKYAELAKERLKEIEVFEIAKGNLDLSHYEANYPNGIFEKEVEELKNEIKIFKNCEANDDFSSYLKTFSDGVFIEKINKGLYNKSTKNEKDVSTLAEKQAAIKDKKGTIDFFGEDGTTETSVSKAPVTFTTLKLSKSEYFQFDLETHWQNTAVRNIWMSKEACRAAYSLIEDATKEAIMQEEVIPEVGGFLVGEVHLVAPGTYDLKVEKFVSVTPENNGEFEVSFGKIAFDQLEEVLINNKKLITVGWVHTHPGHGLFLSNKDEEVIIQNFRDPYYVSMEVETKTKNLDTAFFTWKRGTMELNNTQSDKSEKDWFHWADVKVWLYN